MPNDTPNTHPKAGQIKSYRQQKMAERLALTRRRIKEKARAQRALAHQREVIHIATSRSIADRARQACWHTEGVDLKSWLLQTIESFAELVFDFEADPEAPARADAEEERQLSGALMNVLDGCDEVTAAYLADEVLGREDRAALTRIGLAMRELRWRRIRVNREGRWVWVYKRPSDQPIVSDEEPVIPIAPLRVPVPADPPSEPAWFKSQPDADHWEEVKRKTREEARRKWLEKHPEQKEEGAEAP